MSKVKSVSEFLKEIFTIIEKPQYKGLVPFYRGEARDYGETSNQPGIFRNKNLMEKEDYLFKQFIAFNPDEFYHDKFTIDKLVKMQHYGLKTRLLDLSENALLALYMAIVPPPLRCSEHKDEDAIVYIFLVPKDLIKFPDSDTVTVIANLVKEPVFELNKHYKDEKRFNERKRIKRLLNNIKDEKPYFEDRIKPKHLSSVVCLRPLQNNKRIIRQQGLFLLFGNDKNNKYQPAKLEDSKIKVRKVIIDKHYQKKMIKQLETTGISKAVVYPDLQEIAEYLTSGSTK